MDQKFSLRISPDRFKKLLPTYYVRKGKTVKRSAREKLSIEEADQILELDKFCTPSELSSAILGRSDVLSGVKLVELAEKITNQVHQG